MKRTNGRMVFALAAVLAATVGAGEAVAGPTGGGGDLKQTAAHISQRAALGAAVADTLGTTEAKLRAAVKASARANIAAALAADRITAAEAETLNEALTDGSIPAMRLATAAGVAKQLDVTVTRLNDAVSSAVKAQITARIDQALKDGKITAAAAAEMKVKIAGARFPGFGAGGHGHHGPGHGGPGQRGMGGPNGGGMGFGPPPGAGPPAGR